MDEKHELVRNLVLYALQHQAPMKGAELYSKVVQNFYEVPRTQARLTAEDITISLEKLVASGEVQEIEYVLPDTVHGTTPGRIKSLYFPSGTELEVVKPTQKD